MQLFTGQSSHLTRVFRHKYLCCRNGCNPHYYEFSLCYIYISCHLVECQGKKRGGQGGPDAAEDPFGDQSGTAPQRSVKELKRSRRSFHENLKTIMTKSGTKISSTEHSRDQLLLLEAVNEGWTLILLVWLHCMTGISTLMTKAITAMDTMEVLRRGRKEGRKILDAGRQRVLCFGNSLRVICTAKCKNEY